MEINQTGKSFYDKIFYKTLKFSHISMFVVNFEEVVNCGDE